ncbi:ABC transporter substrate-binding protein [Chloroflexota bacterium]
MKSPIQYAIVLTLVLTACTEPTTPPTPITPDASLTPTLEPTQTTTPSPTPTSTLTLTPTDRPTPTSTLTLTPTPLGYYVHGSDAYTLIYPPGWDMSDGELPENPIENESESLKFFGASLFLDQSQTDPEGIAELLGEEIRAITTPAAQNETILLKDGTPAQHSIIYFKVSGKEYAIHLVRAQKQDRAYTFMIIGPSPNIADNQADIQSIFESIELRPGLVHGLDQAQTLVLLGSDPLPEDLDPARDAGSADDYIGHLYSGLVRMSPQMQVEPDLAESWALSADGTVYTFTLRSDAAFQSGRQLIAQDVKYSWERAADPQTESPTVSTYLGDIIGIREKLSGEADEITGVQVVDDRTLVVRLDGPKPYFPAKLTYPTSYIVDRENVESDPDSWMFHPNASGPFGLKEFREEESIIFERNNAYHTQPAIDNIVYRLYQVGSRISYFKEQEIDFMGIGSSDARTIMDNPEDPLNELLYSTTSMCTTYIKFNNTRPPMDDLQFRKALTLSLDREHINELFYENLSVVARSILPPAMPGHDAGREIVAYDPLAAKAALDASSYADDAPTIVINLPGDGSSDSPYIDALIQMWRETLDLEVVIDYVDPRDRIDGLNEADGHIVTGGWCADYPDPENFLDILFYSDSVFNGSNYNNLEVDALLEAARVEFDPSRRIERYQEIETILLQDYAFVPMVYRVFYALANPRVEGYILTPMGVPIVHLLSIEASP